MANKKISQLTAIVTVDTAADLFPIVDTSAIETKSITPSALKTALSLNNVDNTTDANKPVSTATQTALNAKQDTLVSATNIKTINSTSILGSGNIVVGATPSGIAGAIQFSDGSAFASDATNFFWDDTNNRLGIGTNAPTSRLQVRGDGTNPVARFESSAGANFLLINNSGQAVFGSAGANEPYLVNYNGTLTESGLGHSLRIRQRANTGSTGNTLIQYWADGLFSGTTSGIAISHEFLSSGFSGAAGSGNYRNLSIGYTINNSGAQTGTATGIFLNATETALNGQTHNLMDLQVGGIYKLRVKNTGELVSASDISATTGGYLQWEARSSMRSITDGIIALYDFAKTSFNRLQLGGTTSSFPAIKRNGTAIDIRLADDSGYASLNCGNISAISGGIIGGNAGVALGFTYVGAEVNSTGFYGWSSTATVSATMDTNLSRISAGLVGVGTGTTSNVLGGISLSRLIAAGLPTTRPTTVGEFYQDTAANILANGDKVVGIRQ